MEKGLYLDLERHQYFFDGVRIGGVSEILTSLGIVDDRSYFTEYAAGRGIAVHAALEFHMTGGLDWSSVEERIKGYVDAGVKFLQDAGVKPGPGTIVERPIWHPAMRYAGMPDLITVAFGRDSIIDYKSGAIGTAGIATAMYEQAARLAFPPSPPVTVRGRMAVLLHKNGTYSKKELVDGFDYSDAMNAASLFNKFHLPKIFAATRRSAA